MSNIADLTLTELAGRIKKREISAVEAAAAYLDNIRKNEPGICAFMEVFEKEALSRAGIIDEKISSGSPVGELAGVPVAVKDNISVRGSKLSCSSKILHGYVPPYNATVIEKLSGADAVILGRTNMDEFAMGSSTENSAYKKTRNPRDTERVPGGSSGGSAAAVAAGFSAAALGSDTGGSIRQPASFCGVAGMKPTYGRVSRYGLVAFASSLDQIGPLARTALDCALMLKIISGYDRLDSTSVDLPVPDYPSAVKKEPAGIKAGLPREYFSGRLDRDVDAAVRNAIRKMEKSGVIFKEISLPHTEYAVAVYYIIASSEASSNLARYDGVRYGNRIESGGTLIDAYNLTRGEGFGSEVKRRIMLGTYALSAGYYDAYYLKAQKVRTLIRKDFENAFRSVDVIVTPTSPTTAFRLGEKTGNPLQMYLSDIFTIPCNLAGLPGISVPCGKAADGLPVGLQVIGKPFEEETILRLAHHLEKETIPGEN